MIDKPSLPFSTMREHKLPTSISSNNNNTFYSP
jgi:hypothetical protein